MYDKVKEDEEYSLLYFIDYIRENYIGLLLLLLAFFIIYVVDYISRINALIFAMPSPIPGISSSSTIQPPKLHKKKNKKR